MRKLSRVLVTAAIATGLAGAATPAFADHHWGYDCVRYPCYPEDYVEYISGHLITIEYNDPVVCVRFPCPQPVPYTVCVNPLAVCTPR